MKPANARDIVAAMAAYLRSAGIPETEREAIRLLLAGGFRYGEIVVCIDDALVEARQQAVTEAMAEAGHGG
ncbi:hypothetical protein [Bradyrhizobium cosmicum]|uniref:Uncharacterized protein n=1 Tax=Bradyrhizobium cosmicum TaxID=1404864 RepID=A0AAI8MCQ8_9BRAD|nr:hypothetical protein [Bradyrhizobium cosmicum]BAL75966.1 hypothetical protein S23_27540 [Bradyrhizobium cosmicum]